MLFLLPGLAPAAPHAAFVVDTRDGRIYHSENADTPLHPASLTKMMTLYIAFEALEAGELAEADLVTVSARAAREPGSSWHLQTGDRISVADLVSAVAIRSANDAATALAEAIAGDEAAFVERMNRTAARMGLTGTTFRNAHGLTEEGHLATARDMARLGRFLFFDFPGRYAMFRQIGATIGERRVAHTNRRFLGGYGGADGIKTGYTRASGYSLTASARRGEAHVIVALFGAESSAERADEVSRLLDRAFAEAPETTQIVHPGGTRDGPAAGTHFLAALGPSGVGFAPGSVLHAPSGDAAPAAAPFGAIAPVQTAPIAPALGGIALGRFIRP